MNLNELQPQQGSNKARMRVGRGIGSGKGKTSGRGVKGQKARTGVAVKGFEGGQTPIFRRLPKRGFVSINRKEFATLSLGKLQAAIDAKRLDIKNEITEEILLQAGVISSLKHGVKILGTGELTSKVTLRVTALTKSALAAVEKAGGKIESLA
jgi:large subunit ribosomal protein L15